MNIKSGIRKALNSVKRHDVELLVGLGIVGMISGTIMAVKATPKAIELIEKEKEEQNVEELSTIDTVKTVWHCYIPTVIIEALALTCIVGASVSNSKRNAALAAAYALSETTLREYQSKVVETIGEKKEAAIHDEIAKDKIEKNPVNEDQIIFTGKGDTLCYESLSGRYFKSDIELIRKAENEFNRWLRNESYISLNEWYDYIGLDGIGIGNDLGWNFNDGDLELRFSSQLTPNGTPCLVLGYVVPPHYYYHSRY